MDKKSELEWRWGNQCLTYYEAVESMKKLNEERYLGYDDWRFPTIKELYSLIDFSETDPSGYVGKKVLKWNHLRPLKGVD
ncbi:DUF1566 domain-containing protein [Thermotoga sp. KOL6]|uniref:Lcl C-terminal domain-containing protein n=1 Tax=Thermotoga sp. KOL6 TaxID=126741 RepID=UPI000C76FC3E